MPDTDAAEVVKPLGTPPSNVASVTTPEEDRTTASQRRVNLIWETTQAVIAVSVTVTACVIASVRATGVATAPTGDNGSFQLLGNAFFLIIGFYFSRTNHTKVGGIGAKDGKER